MRKNRSGNRLKPGFRKFWERSIPASFLAALSIFAAAVSAKLKQPLTGEPEERLRAPLEKLLEESGELFRPNLPYGGMMKSFLLLLMFLGAGFPACAEGRVFLYGDYYAGMSAEEFFRTGPANCDKFPDNEMICNRQEIAFVWLKWAQFFQFSKDRLICVGFGHTAPLKAFGPLFSWLMAEKYVPIKAEAGGDIFNFPLSSGEISEKEYLKKFKQFNRDLPSVPRFDASLMKLSSLKEYRATGKFPADAILVRMGGNKKRDAIFISFELASEASLRDNSQ